MYNDQIVTWPERKDRLPTVITVGPRCPYCDAPNPHVPSTKPDRDTHIRLRYARCRGCDRKFRWITE